MRQSIISLIVILGSSMEFNAQLQVHRPQDTYPMEMIEASDYLPESPIIGLTPPTRDGVDNRIDRPPFRSPPHAPYHQKPRHRPPKRKRTRSRYRNNVGPGKRMRRPKGPFKVVGKRKTCSYRRKLVNQPPRFQRRSDPNSYAPRLNLDDSHRHGRSHSKRNLLAAGHLARERTMKYYNNLPNHGQTSHGYSPNPSAGKYDLSMRTGTRSLPLYAVKEAPPLPPFDLNLLNNYRILIREYSYLGDADSDEQLRPAGGQQRRRTPSIQFQVKRPSYSPAALVPSYHNRRRNGFNNMRINQRRPLDFHLDEGSLTRTQPVMDKKSLNGIHHKPNLLPNAFRPFISSPSVSDESDKRNSSDKGGILIEGKAKENDASEDEAKKEYIIRKPVIGAYSGSINLGDQHVAQEKRKKTQKIYSSVIRASGEGAAAALDMGLHHLKTTAINSKTGTPLTLMEPNKSTNAPQSHGSLSPNKSGEELPMTTTTTRLTTEHPDPTSTEEDVIYVTPEPYSNDDEALSGGLTGNKFETMTMKTMYSSSYKNHLDYQRDDGLIDFSKQLNLRDHARMKKLLKNNAPVTGGLLANGWRPIYPNSGAKKSSNESFRTVTIAPNKHWVTLMKK